MSSNKNTTKRTIRNPQAFIGKVVSSRCWNIPDGYHLCAKTGKLFAEDDLLVTFSHQVFDRQWLLDKHIYVEDAEWLSEEGYNEIIDVLKAEGRYQEYLDKMFGGWIKEDGQAPASLPTPVQQTTSDNPSRLFCPCCGDPLRIERQPNYRRIDGKLTEVDPLWLCTCDNIECPFGGFTVVSTTFDDPKERNRYGLTYAPFDVRTGEYIPAWKRYSNCGPDVFRSRWERHAYELHAGKVSA